MVSFSYFSTSIRIMINRSISSRSMSVLPESIGTLHSFRAWLFGQVGREVFLMGGKGAPERSQLFTHLVREELGQGLVQGKQHGSRIASGPFQVDALLFRHASR